MNSENSFKSKRQAPYDKTDGLISYPEVVANPINTIPNPSVSVPDGVISYGNFLNFADPGLIGNASKPLQQQPPVTTAQPIQITPATNTTSSPEVVGNKTKETQCSRFLNSDNATAVLEKVLEELELIRKTKEGTATPEGIKRQFFLLSTKFINKFLEGAACNIIGSWNSEVIGLRFDISARNDTANDLIVKLNEHNPPKRVTLMNTNWTSSGYILRRQGGPFYLWASKNKEDTLATFTGNGTRFIRFYHNPSLR